MIPLTSAEIMTGNSMFSLSVTLTNTFCLWNGILIHV
jgi:hypothetical protein